MFRVLLPTGELTLSTRIEFLKGTFNKEKGRLELSRLESMDSISKANYMFVHLKSPQTTSEGILVGNLNNNEIYEVRSSLLEKGYFDFSNFSYSSCMNQNKVKYYLLLSENAFNFLLEDDSDGFWNSLV